MKSCQTSRTQNSAFEVDPHLRMQNTSKPRVVTPIVLAVWVCAAVEAWGRFQCPGGTTLPKCYRIPPSPPPPRRPQKGKTDIVDFSGYSSSHMTSLT